MLLALLDEPGRLRRRLSIWLDATDEQVDVIRFG
jgi:hypothetical protein